MTFRFKAARSGAAAAALLLAAAPLHAQTDAPPQAGMVQSVTRTVAADDLSRHLRTLAVSPDNLEAALGAGDAALTLGDAHAAAGFFARAERIAVRDGRAKAGLGRAFLALDRPRDAIELFDDATDYGIPDAAVAADRGLAWDLRGEPRRAQRDYALALQARADDDLTRRYALSLGISGERDRALALLDPLLYQRDPLAWRARAFVLALTGDLPGAMEIVRQVMPAGQAESLQPFLRRLPSLRAARKAAAVHLGRFQDPPPRRAAQAPRPQPVPAPPPAPPATPVVEEIAPPAQPPSGPATWVQLASGNERAMPAEWRRLAARAPAALDGREAMLTGTAASARLLVGPFDTAAAARAFVAELRTAGITAFAWTSGAGTAVRALP